ncbi:type II/IV secretion system ATPase subunit, partial [Methanoregula sp.]|uniref:type II/IV secretion system ATPase subunit n=1 Tax=Methanoregula sp. TaxID=2052170 RepID=UPI002624519B
MTLRNLTQVIYVTLSNTFSGFRTDPASTQSSLQAPTLSPATKDPAAQSTTVLRKVISPLQTIPTRLGNRTDTGDALILAVFLVSFLTGYAALLVDLPIPVLGLLGIISVATLALTGSAAWHRFHPESVTRNDTRVVTKPPLAACDSREDSETRSKEQDLPLPSGQEPGLLERYWIESPFVSIRILRRGNAGFTYTVDEPSITPQEQAVLLETSGHLRKVIVYDDPEKPPAQKLDDGTVSRIIREFHPRIADDRLAVLSYYLRRDLSGFGPLEALMRDPALEDISCNGENLPVFVFHRTHGSLPTNILFREGELDQFVLKLAQKANKQISLSNPMVDATLPGGSRVQITFSNIVSLRGSSFTIRKFRADPMTPLDLIRYGTYSPEVLAFLWLAIEHRKSLIIAGGTASGKTSTMNAVSLFIPLNAKIVSLEDTHEIQLPHKNWLATITREIAVSGVQGDIDLFSLLKASMRQRPEFIIVGEVRGREAQTLFQAMNTGHATLSTLHAGSVREAVNRLTHEPISVPPVMFTALDLVISQSVFTYGNQRIRRCSAINEISVDDG